MRNRFKKTVLICAAVLLSGCAYLIVYRKTGIGIPCLFRLVTHLNCPGCGVTRMLESLLRLDIVSAFHYNACLLILFPVLIALFVRWAYLYIRYGSFKGTTIDQILNATCVVVLIIWGIVRNILQM